MNPVETILFDNINTPNTLFVFPTDIAVSHWADHLLRIKGGTIPMDKFIAWDKFKQKSIKSKVQNKKSIPSALRKIFVSRLVQENAEACKAGNTPVFSSLIMVKWAQQAQQFTSWLAGILPQLGVWFNKRTGLSIDDILTSGYAADKFKGDDKDMYTLAFRYAQFLEKYSLFEPAWETPPFNNDGFECFIFFPEALSDFIEYKELLSTSNHVKIIKTCNTDNLSHTFYYTNARKEITEAALYIRALHENNNINWSSIAVCIPDSEYYEPYVLREFTNRNIPFVKRTSKPLTNFPAGRFFRAVIDCISQDFAFSSFINLVLNKNLPWKNTEFIHSLVNFGIKNNCISSWKENKDGKENYINVWEDAFSNPFDYLDFEARSFFGDLKKYLKSLRLAASFQELRKQYFIFREQFFDMELCTDETDIVLSRCISELMELTELEKSFPEVPAADPFLFFTEYLDDVNYLAQTNLSGVSVLPYKTAASAIFDCHIILGAAQKNLSVVYSRLNFLAKNKREELGITDEDASFSFINLHKFNSKISSAFFCSELTFTGYEIAHSKINAPLKPNESYSGEYFSKDYYQLEGNSEANLTLHENQKDGFNKWKNRSIKGTQDKRISDYTLDYIRSKLAYNKEIPEKISVSASSLKTYCQCSLKWLFNRILKLDNAEIETTLMAEDLSGTVYHAVLELFFTEIKNETLPKPVISDNEISLPTNYTELLCNCIDKIFSGFPALPNENGTKMSALTMRFLLAAKRQYQFNLENCLSHFLSLFWGGRIKNTEAWYKSQKDSYFLNGKLDCILEDRNGDHVIVDFKLGEPPKRKDCTNADELLDLQLPMYITLAEENEEIKIKNAMFFSIIKLIPEVIIGHIYDEISEKNYPKKAEDIISKESEEYNQLMSQFENKVKQFADEVSTGKFTVFETDINECFKCKYNRICRKVYTIKSEKNILLDTHHE